MILQGFGRTMSGFRDRKKECGGCPAIPAGREGRCRALSWRGLPAHLKGRTCCAPPPSAAVSLLTFCIAGTTLRGKDAPPTARWLLCLFSPSPLAPPPPPCHRLTSYILYCRNHASGQGCPSYGSMRFPATSLHSRQDAAPRARWGFPPSSHSRQDAPPTAR